MLLSEKSQEKITIEGFKRFIEAYNPYRVDISEMESELIKDFGRKMREKRKNKGMTQERLGEKAGISGKYIGELERGEKIPSLLVICKIAAALEINPANLVCLFDEACVKNEHSLKDMALINKILITKDAATLGKILKVLKIVF